MTQPVVRWGIISTGHIAGVFRDDLRLLPDHEVVAVGSRDAERARQFAAANEIPHAYGSYADLVADPDVDVVYVGTPHSDHVDTVQTALRAGKAVLCEKAFTVNADQARLLADLARQSGVFCMEAMWMWCNPVQLRLYDLLASGEIGEVRSVTANLGFTATYDANSRLFEPELGGGALLDVGVYPVAFAYRLLGAPTSIQAHATLADTGVDSTTAMQFGYASGAVAQLVGSFDAELSKRATIAGTKGWIELPPDFHHAPHFTIHRAGREPETYHEPTVGGGYVYEAEEVARCLREGRTESSLVPLDDTVAVLRTLDEVRAQIGVRYPADE